MSGDRVLDAIKKANKLGARGLQVVGYREPESASSSPDLILETQIPDDASTAVQLWYE